MLSITLTTNIAGLKMMATAPESLLTTVEMYPRTWFLLPTIKATL